MHPETVEITGRLVSSKDVASDFCSVYSMVSKHHVNDRRSKRFFGENSLPPDFGKKGKVLSVVPEPICWHIARHAC